MILAQPGLGIAAMWIYLLIGLLFLILAVEGYFKGGVNGVITLLGVIIAINFSGALEGLPMAGGSWPSAIFVLASGVAPVAGFITIALLFAIAGLVVSIIIRKHWPIAGTIPDRQLQWDEPQIRLLRGLITAMVYSMMRRSSTVWATSQCRSNRRMVMRDVGNARESRVQLTIPLSKIAAAYDTTLISRTIRDALLMIWMIAVRSSGFIKAYQDSMRCVMILKLGH